MTSDEILAVIRGRVVKWKARPRPDLESEVVREVVGQLLDDLDPDRIDAAGKMREELVVTILNVPTATNVGSGFAYDLADALLKKGWRK